MEYQGFVEFECFWEENKGFENSLESISEGDDAQVILDNAGSRTMCLIVTNNNEESVGVLVNNHTWGNGSYKDFAAAITNAVRCTKFPVKISKIMPKSKVSSRIYFSVRFFSPKKKQVRHEAPRKLAGQLKKAVQEPLVE